MLALLLFALIHLPVKILNKTTQKNHETISGWFARPRAWWTAATGWIALGGYPLAALGAGVLISTGLYVFVDPHFPGKDGAVEYALGMLLGFALVGLVFFGTWRYVIHRLEPECAGRWRIYPTYILVAAVLVMMARLAVGVIVFIFTHCGSRVGG